MRVWQDIALPCGRLEGREESGRGGRADAVLAAAAFAEYGVEGRRMLKGLLAGGAVAALAAILATGVVALGGAEPAVRRAGAPGSEAEAQARTLALAQRIESLEARRQKMIEAYAEDLTAVQAIDGEIKKAFDDYEAAVRPVALRILGRITALDMIISRWGVQGSPGDPEIGKAFGEKAALEKDLYAVVRFLAVEKAAALGVRAKVPRGFHAAAGTVFEPYTGTGCAKEIVHDKTGIAMVFVPAGEFEMGGGFPPYQVRMTSGFYLGKYEVTQGQWRGVMGENPSHFKGDEDPVESVSWNDCGEFARKAGDGLRLPSEAEWEYACRAGAALSPDDGEADPDRFGWFAENSGNGTHPVGRKLANAWGLYDMLGNVSEWCQDWKGDYPSGVAADPQGPPSGLYRVLRGGSWGNESGLCGPIVRGAFDPSATFVSVGFRVARDVPPGT